MASKRKGNEGNPTDQGPFIGSSDRPDLTIDLDARVGDMTVRQLAAILAPQRVGAWKPLKDLKDSRKDFKDGKDLIDTGSPLFKEIIDSVTLQKGPERGIPGGTPGADPGSLEELIKRITGLEQELERLQRQEGGGSGSGQNTAGSENTAGSQKPTRRRRK